MITLRTKNTTPIVSNPCTSFLEHQEITKAFTASLRIQDLVVLQCRKKTLER
ncbi:hypothetical protein Sjap_010346 [Stephania japonica]|uniref:Uncharacterized protein n=1 Tax=Stephania japonica TaxID=461633 RepID=A0AAP0J9E8_9MAGN